MLDVKGSPLQVMHVSHQDESKGEQDEWKAMSEWCLSEQSAQRLYKLHIKISSCCFHCLILIFKTVFNLPI